MLDDKEKQIIGPIDLIESFNNKIKTLIENNNANYRYIENTMTEIIDNIWVDKFTDENLYPEDKTK